MHLHWNTASVTQIKKLLQSVKRNSLLKTRTNVDQRRTAYMWDKPILY